MVRPGAVSKPFAFGLFDLLVRIDAPELLLNNPAVEARSVNTTPAARATLDSREHTRLQSGDHSGVAVALVVKVHEFFLVLGGDDHWTPPCQNRALYPSPAAFPTATPPPLFPFPP